MQLGEKILQLRKDKGMSQEEFANALNVTRQSISLWETNQTVPSLDNLKEIANLFDVSLDELCGTHAKTNEEIYIAKTGYFASGKVLYTKDILERVIKISWFKPYFLNAVIWAIIITTIFIFIKSYLLIPFGILVDIIAFYLKYTKSSKIQIDTQLKLKPNNVLTYYFYEDYFEVESKSDNSSANYSKKYTDIVNVKFDNEYIFLFFNGLIAPITKSSFTFESYQKILHLLGKDDNSNKFSNKKALIKSILIILFISSIVSIFASLTLTTIFIGRDPIPEFPGIMPEYAWSFFVFLPIPLASIILGFIFVKKGFKCKKNIVAGIIMTFFLSMFGGFSIIDSFQVEHDFTYVNKIANITSVSFPNEGYISTSFSNTGKFSMVRFDQKNDMLELVNTDGRWQNNQFFIPMNAITNTYVLLTTNYDYFLYYDINCNKFNYINNTHTTHKYYYFAYSIEKNILVIIEDTLSL